MLSRLLEEEELRMERERGVTLTELKPGESAPLNAEQSDSEGKECESRGKLCD